MLFRSRRSNWRWSRGRHRCGSCSRRRWGRRHRRSDHRRGGHCSSRLGRRWIKQQGVFTNQTARGPCQVENHVHERLLNRAFAGNLQIGAPVTSTLQGDLCRSQHRVVVNACCTIGFRRGHTDLQRRTLFCTETGDINFGPKRFAQSRLDIELTQSQSPGRSRRQSQNSTGSSNSNPIEGEFPRGHRMIFQGVSQVVMEPCDTTSGALRSESDPQTHPLLQTVRSTKHNNIKHIRRQAQHLLNLRKLNPRPLP